MRVTKTSEEHAAWRGAFAILIGLPLFGSAPARAAAPEPLRVVSLRTEYKENPARASTRGSPLELAASRARTRRRAVGLPDPRGAERRAACGGGADLVWDSGRVTSDESIQRAYDGPPLRSGQRYHWQVRVWDGSGQAFRLERAGVLGDGPPRRRRTGRRAGSSRTCRRTSRSRGPRPCSGASSRLEGAIARGARLRHEPRPLRDADQRPARGRPALHARAGRATTSACSTRPTT